MAMPLKKRPEAEVLAIAHNGNLSNGRMFPIIESFSGQAIDRELCREPYAKWEPLYEVTQIKGDRRDASVPVAER